MKIATVTLLVGLSAVSSSQEPPATAAALNAKAIQAYQAKDYDRFLAYEKQALTLEPNNPRIVYNVACGESLAGNVQNAVRLLDQLLEQKIDLGAETDTDFAGIRKTPEWAAFVSRLRDLRKPVVHSQVAFTLPDPAVVATGIAVDPRATRSSPVCGNGRFFVEPGRARFPTSLSRPRMGSWPATRSLWTLREGCCTRLRLRCHSCLATGRRIPDVPGSSRST
jgi:hypothetical protein